MQFGQAGQQDRAQRDAEHSGWKLHQAVCVIKPRHASTRQEGCEHGIDEQRDLAHRDAQRGRRHEFENAIDAGVAQGEVELGNIPMRRSGTI